jgi:hypothetical protein
VLTELVLPKQPCRAALSVRVADTRVAAQARAACREYNVIRAAAPEAVGHSCPHARATAHAHAALQRRVLLAQLRTLTQRARSRSALVAHAARVAGPHVAAATVLPHSRDRTMYFSVSLTINQTPFDPALHELRLVPNSVVSPRTPSTGSRRRKRVNGVV